MKLVGLVYNEQYMSGGRGGVMVGGFTNDTINASGLVLVGLGWVLGGLCSTV